jgi:hypothetical protein
MSLATGHYQLSSAMKTLNLRWEYTCMAWRDVVRREFTVRYWNTLEGQLPGLLSAIDKLDVVLATARQECE